MKNLSIYLLLTLLFFASCSKQEKEEVILDEITCKDGCLFAMEEIEATIIYMDCFQKYAIQTRYPDDKSITIYGVPANLKEEFQKEGKEVVFTARFRENTLIPQFLDPSFNMASIYEIELIEVK